MACVHGPAADKSDNVTVTVSVKYSDMKLTGTSFGIRLEPQTHDLLGTFVFLILLAPLYHYGFLSIASFSIDAIRFSALTP